MLGVPLPHGSTPAGLPEKGALRSLAPRQGLWARHRWSNQVAWLPLLAPPRCYSGQGGPVPQGLGQDPSPQPLPLGLPPTLWTATASSGSPCLASAHP